jgi:hypothetical protein
LFVGESIKTSCAKHKTLAPNHEPRTAGIAVDVGINAAGRVRRVHGVFKRAPAAQ